MQTCTAMQRTAEPILLVGGLGIWQSFTSRSSEKLYTTGTSYPHTCIARYLLPTCKFSPVMMISCVVTPTSQVPTTTRQLPESPVPTVITAVHWYGLETSEFHSLEMYI